MLPMVDLYTGRHTVIDCRCGHSAHSPGVESRPELSKLSDSVICPRCDQKAELRQKSDAKLSWETRILSEQAEQFISQLSLSEMDLSDAQRFDDEGELIAAPANAYARLEAAERLADPAEYSALQVGRQTAQHVKERLSDICAELRSRKSEG